MTFHCQDEVLDALDLLDFEEQFEVVTITDPRSKCRFKMTSKNEDFKIEFQKL